jgi:hypothetical protein
VAAGGTRNHFPWGENGRPQDGAAALVDEPQPADAPARPQRDQLLGVHLPDVVGPAGAAAVARRPAALGSRAEAGLVEPALQGALRGHGGAGVVAAQEDADQAGPPAGVVAAEGQRLVAQPRGGCGARAATTVGGGGEGGGAGAPAAAQELADGAGREAEVAGDGGGSLTALVAAEDGATEGERGRRWHGESSQRADEPGCSRQHTASGQRGKTVWRIERQNFMSHLTAKLYVG